MPKTPVQVVIVVTWVNLHWPLHPNPHNQLYIILCNNYYSPLHPKGSSIAWRPHLIKHSSRLPFLLFMGPKLAYQYIYIMQSSEFLYIPNYWEIILYIRCTTPPSYITVSSGTYHYAKEGYNTPDALNSVLDQLWNPLYFPSFYF